MVIRGRIEHGVVVLEEPVTLPEGMEVSVVEGGKMVLSGHVENGVIVLDNGIRLSEGTRVSVVTEPSAATEEPRGQRDRMSEEEHRRILEIMDRIAALPIEGMQDPFSGADHDKVLYGKP